MILHYLKIAWRNLLKYRTQNIISIIGLAVGLFSFTVCFYCSRFIESRDIVLSTTTGLRSCVCTILRQGIIFPVLRFHCRTTCVI